MFWLLFSGTIKLGIITKLNNGETEMMSSQHIIDVSEATFQNDVVIYSNTTPVLVDFWAEWCQPCHMLSPILEKLTREANGAFRLAKVDADRSPNLTTQLDVRSLPTVKVFNKGKMVAEFTGARTENQVREFLRKLNTNGSSLELERGQSLLRLQNWDNATASFQKILRTSPDDSAALLGLARSQLAQGQASEALVILRAFPSGKEYSMAEMLLPLAQAMAEFKLAAADPDEDELTAAFRRAVELVGRGNLPAAADGLLDILRADKKFRAGEAHRVMLGVLVMMGDENPDSRQYRSELASVLF